MRARMAIHYAGVKTILREVVLSDKPQEMLQLSPKATVPVLVLEDGAVLDESIDILFWALGISDEEGWLGSLDKQDLVFSKNLIIENDSEFKTHLDHYKYAERFPQQSMEEHREQGEIFLKKLDQYLQHHDYLLGNKLSFCDVAIFPFVRQFAYVDFSWFEQTPYLSLQRWLQRLIDSALFTAVMEKNPAWKNGDEICFV